MTVTLLHEIQAIPERYASYAGRRIPCERGAVAYHLSPLAADRCCGLDRAALARFRALAPLLEVLPWKGVDMPGDAPR